MTDLYHIVAVSEGGIIGRENRLPWHSPADLRHFKKITTGHTIIMGRKTFESIGQKPLPGRDNFVLSRSRRSLPAEENPKFFSSLEDALRNVPTRKAFVIGGAELFRETLNQICGIYLTWVKGSFQGDVYYPAKSVAALEELGFNVASRENSGEDPRLEFLELHKKRG